MYSLLRNTLNVDSKLQNNTQKDTKQNMENYMYVYIVRRKLRLSKITKQLLIVII